MSRNCHLYFTIVLILNVFKSVKWRIYSIPFCSLLFIATLMRTVIVELMSWCDNKKTHDRHLIIISESAESHERGPLCISGSGTGYAKFK